MPCLVHVAGKEDSCQTNAHNPCTTNQKNMLFYMPTVSNTRACSLARQKRTRPVDLKNLLSPWSVPKYHRLSQRSLCSLRIDSCSSCCSHGSHSSHGAVCMRQSLFMCSAQCMLFGDPNIGPDSSPTKQTYGISDVLRQQKRKQTKCEDNKFKKASCNTKTSLRSHKVPHLGCKKQLIQFHIMR